MILSIQKLWGFIFILAFLPFDGFSQFRDQLHTTGWEQNGLQGKVKEILHKEYEPRFSTDTSYKLVLYDFLAPHNYQLIFDKRGYLNYINELRKQGDSLIVGAVWQYHYFENNKLQRKDWISFRPRSDTMTWIYQYIGDTTIIEYLGRSFTLINQIGEFEYVQSSNYDSTYKTRMRMVYDNRNRLIRKENYKTSDYIEFLTLRIFQNDTLNKPYKEIFIDHEHHQSHYRSFKYDEFGNKILMTIGNFSGEKQAENRYEYIYDHFGNWIEKRHYGRNGKLATVYTREIMYFED